VTDSKESPGWRESIDCAPQKTEKRTHGLSYRRPPTVGSRGSIALATDVSLDGSESPNFHRGARPIGRAPPKGESGRVGNPGLGNRALPRVAHPHKWGASRRRPNRVGHRLRRYPTPSSVGGTITQPRGEVAANTPQSSSGNQRTVNGIVLVCRPQREGSQVWHILVPAP